MKNKKPLKESGPSGIEAKTKKYARDKGCYVRKFQSMNQRSVPDNIFITPSGATFFIEMKSPGKRPTRAQESEINKILKNKGYVFVVDNLNEDGFTPWKKYYLADIEVWHCGYRLIDMMMLVKA